MEISWYVRQQARQANRLVDPVALALRHHLLMCSALIACLSDVKHFDVHGHTDSSAAGTGCTTNHELHLIQVRQLARSFGISGDHTGQQSTGYRCACSMYAIGRRSHLWQHTESVYLVASQCRRLVAPSMTAKSLL